MDNTENNEVWSKSQEEWLPIIELLPDDSMYFARVYDPKIGDSFAISRESAGRVRAAEMNARGEEERVSV